MKERAQEKGFNFPYLFDESQEVAHAYGAERTPEVYLFGKDGTLLYHGTIDDNYDDPEAVKYHFVRDALDATLDGEEPPCRRDPAYRLHYKMEVKNQQQSLSCIGQSGKNEKTKQEVSEA
jgi:hypothetical protein